MDSSCGDSNPPPSVVEPPDRASTFDIPLAFTGEGPSGYEGPFHDVQLGQPIRAGLEAQDENLHWERREDGLWHVRCNLCGTLVNTGNGKTQTTGTLSTHQLGKSCKKLRNGVQVYPPHVEAAARAEAQMLRRILLPPSSPPRSWTDFLTDTTSPRTPPPSLEHFGDLFDVITPHRYGELVYPDLESGSGSDIEIDILPPVDIRQHAAMHATSFSPCSGIPLEWPRDKFFETYPFQRHGFSASALGYKFCSVEKDGAQFWVRADSCTRLRSEGSEACIECFSVREKVARLAAMAQFALPHTNHAYLTHEQLRELLRDRDQTLQHWKLKSLNLLRKCAATIQKLDDCHRFIMAVATSDVPRLGQLVTQCLKEKASVAKIIGRIEDALNGAYQARGYDSDDYDMALLVLRLGGRKLLYSMSQYIALPSLRALRRAAPFTRLMPSLGTPRLDDILFNIKELFLSKIPSLNPGGVRPFHSGVVLMWDEVNMEETACYFPHADAVGGFCREHSASVNTRLSTFDAAVNLARRLFEGTLHYGKEASVIAVSSFGRSLRGAFPVLVSPTCKAESPQDSGKLLSTVIEAWSTLAASYFGPIWSFASDGDAGRRAMVYQQFMKHPIRPDNPLFPYLGNLPGLNLHVGDNDITGDFDWKHELKRIGRLFRTQEGVMIGTTIINHETFKRHLRRSDRTESDVEQLMNPADSQDVPRAIEFLEAVEEIGVLPTTGCNPAALQEAQLIGAVGELFVAFMDAFIQPEWSLGEQLTSLSKFAHASFALFRHGGVNFMPNQLYGDMQMTVKNAFFCVAKQQLLDDLEPFYLFWLGDDRLETLFGRVRMQGAHNPNFSFKQLLDRLAAAMDLDAIFTRHPHLDPGFRRLKITRTEHLDHLNPESWTGCASVKTVSLESSWRAGRAQAQALLDRINITVNFDTIFSASPSADLFCRRPDGSWPGVALDEPEDRSLEPGDLNTPHLIMPEALTGTLELSDTAFSQTSSTLLPNPLSGLPPSDHSISNSQSSVSTSATETYSMTDDQLNNFLASQQANHSHSRSESEDKDSGASEGAEGLDLEEAIEEPESQQLPRLANISASTDHWLEYEGKKIHKASICRLVITPDYTRKSHERLLRVRGYTSEFKFRPNYDTSDVLASDGYMVGDLFTTFIRCDKQACLAVVKTIAIEEKSGVRVERVLTQNLTQPASGIKLTGQILALRATTCSRYLSTSTGSSAIDDDPPSESLDTPYSWAWDGSYVQLSLPGKQATPASTSKSIRKTLVIRIPSYICEPINPHVVDLKDRLPLESVPQLNKSGLTWELTDAELTVLTATVWDRVQRHNALALLPRFRESDNFPYRDASGHTVFISEPASQLLASTVQLHAGDERQYEWSFSSEAYCVIY
ncbi:hypothetical protein GSI_01366 [Ganoderma sinense ZZ0214-1]|uniref:Uncharacterized protein n=1 Tax=Ganoderma sinense ZZ0214-1 TaxID=1077348 RepID=A0A2G8SVB0_9APHY|nr:hypothetical protein GSI_01366 [Ganoderma sinense ZZ0214-1]